jgi:hypothetical protein
MEKEVGKALTSDVVFGQQDSVSQSFGVSIEKNEFETTSDHTEDDWDSAKGVVGFYCRLVHNHYYLVALIWLCICIAMSVVVLFGPSDERCVGPNGAPGQMQVCR